MITFLLLDGVFQLTPIKLNLLSYQSSAPNFQNLSISGLASYPEADKAIVAAMSDQTCQVVIEEELLNQLSDSITDYLNAELKVVSQHLFLWIFKPLNHFKAFIC